VCQLDTSVWIFGYEQGLAVEHAVNKILLKQCDIAFIWIGVKIALLMIGFNTNQRLIIVVVSNLYFYSEKK
jgi:hypothetical protein